MPDHDEENPLVHRVPHDGDDEEDKEQDDIQAKDHDREPIEPVGGVWELVQQDRYYPRAHVDREPGGREIYDNLPPAKIIPILNCFVQILNCILAEALLAFVGCWVVELRTDLTIGIRGGWIHPDSGEGCEEIGTGERRTEQASILLEDLIYAWKEAESLDTVCLPAAAFEEISSPIGEKVAELPNVSESNLPGTMQTHLKGRPQKGSIPLRQLETS